MSITRNASIWVGPDGETPNTESSSMLSELDAAFEALPEEVQSAFEPAWVIVRNLIQAGKSARAYRFVQSLDVPEELEAARSGILGMIGE